MGIVLCILGTAIGLVCVFIFATEKGKFKPIIDMIDGNEYFIKDTYVIGLSIMQWFGIDISSEIIQKKIKQISEMYGAKEARKIALYDLASEITFAVLITPIAMLIAVIAGEMFPIFAGIVMIGFLIIYTEYDKSSKLNKRRDILNQQFPHMASQVALLVNAGMTLREALTVSSEKGDGILYDEMKVLVQDMENGIADYAALDAFATRCGIDSVRKFSSLISQNVKKGSSELADSLMNLSSEIWRVRVNAVRVEGEKASTKLLVPILIIFIGILIMVVVPMLSNMGSI